MSYDFASIESKICVAPNNKPSCKRQPSFECGNELQKPAPPKMARNQSDDDMLSTIDFTAIESKHSNITSKGPQKSPVKTEIKQEKCIAPTIIKTEPNLVLHKEEAPNNGLSNYKICCLGIKKIPNTNMPAEQSNLSSCIHQLTGFVKEFLSSLKQSKLKWSHECLITDTRTLSEHHVYLGNDTIELLLDFTCAQTKEIFKKSKELNKPRDQDHYALLFEKKKSDYYAKVDTMQFNMHLKYDLDKEMFCVFRIDNIQPRK